MLLKVGSKGQQVKDLQEFLEIGADGIFGEGTKKAVQEFQKTNGLVADGIVGPSTWDTMGIATTDDTEKTFTTENGLAVNRHYLPVGEYKSGITKKEYCFLHQYYLVLQSTKSTILMLRFVYLNIYANV